jgi:hypothetical protein
VELAERLLVPWSPKFERAQPDQAGA